MRAHHTHGANLRELIVARRDISRLISRLLRDYLCGIWRDSGRQQDVTVDLTVCDSYTREICWINQHQQIYLSHVKGMYNTYNYKKIVKAALHKTQYTEFADRKVRRNATYFQPCCVNAEQNCLRCTSYNLVSNRNVILCMYGDYNRLKNLGAFPVTLRLAFSILCLRHRIDTCRRALR